MLSLRAKEFEFGVYAISLVEARCMSMFSLVV